jgi:hypothetical protein
MNAHVTTARRPNNLAGLVVPALAGLVLCVSAAGCPGGRPAAVDESAARQALTAALESWKNGEPYGGLKGRKPPIVVQDLDWETGRTLVDFEILDDGKGEHANLRVPVGLTLREAAGKEVKKRVKYVVGTSPVITVFRELF